MCVNYTHCGAIRVRGQKGLSVFNYPITNLGAAPLICLISLGQSCMKYRQSKIRQMSSELPTLGQTPGPELGLRRDLQCMYSRSPYSKIWIDLFDLPVFLFMCIDDHNTWSCEVIKT